MKNSTQLARMAGLSERQFYRRLKDRCPKILSLVKCEMLLEGSVGMELQRAESDLRDIANDIERCDSDFAASLRALAMKMAEWRDTAEVRLYLRREQTFAPEPREDWQSDQDWADEQEDYAKLKAPRMPWESDPASTPSPPSKGQETGNACEEPPKL